MSVGATNQPTDILRAVGDGTFQHWQFTYDNYGHVIKSIDPANRTLAMTYDSNNIDLLTVTNTTPGTGSTPATNDRLLTLSNYVTHRPQSVTGADGQTTVLAYNAVGQLTSSTDALGDLWMYNYTPANGITVPSSCSGNGTQGCGFLTYIQGPGVGVPNEVAVQIPDYKFTYDGVGRLFTAIGPDNQSFSFYYDNADRLLETVFPDESTESRSYTLLDLTSFTDRMGYTTSRVYDGYRNLTEIDEPLGRTTKLSYGPDGTVVSVTDPLQEPTTYARDVEGRATTLTYPNGSTQFYNYDLLGRVTSVSPDLAATKPGTVKYAYNLDNSVATALLDWRAPTVFSYDDPAYQRVTGWTRIQGGNWAQPACTSGSCPILDAETYSYNPAGSLGAGKVDQVVTTLAAPEGGPGPTIVTSTYGYDPLGRVTSHQVSMGPSGSVINATESFEYDAIGRLTKNANLLDSFAYEYGDPTARIIGRTSTSGPQVAASYFPPAQDGLLEELSYTTPAGAPLGQYTYGYDARHNVTTTGGPAAADQATYTYDAYSQLLTRTPTSTVVPTFTATMDLSGNILSKETALPGTLSGRVVIPGASTLTKFSYDTANEMTKETTTTTNASGSSTVAQTVTYDPSIGSLYGIGSSTTGQAFAYDSSNRLAHYWANASSATSSGFFYDGLGRLSEVFDVVPVTGSIQTTPVADHSYVWCGQKMCVEVNNLERVSVPGLSQPINYPDALYFSQGEVDNPGTISGAPTIQRAYDTTDLLGSERAVVVNNAIVATFSYDTLGNRTGSGSIHGFGGLYYHQTSGLQFARNRVYNANLGRWMTRDPIGNGFAFADPARFNATNLNLYAYAADNPQSRVDPSGNLPDDPSAWEHWQGAVQSCETQDPQGTNTIVALGIGLGLLDLVGPFVALADGILGETGALRALLTDEAGGIDLNKLLHIFGDPGHNLAGLVGQLGSEQAAFQAIETAAQAAADAGQISGQFEAVLNVVGNQVTVRGIVINGVAKIGTAFM